MPPHTNSDPMKLRINSVIVGVHKCATTSLWQALSAHSQVVTHHTGQLIDNYIDAIESGASNDSLSVIRESHDVSKHVLVRDTTLYDDVSRLRELISLFPNLKLIVCVRDPVDRAYSAFFHALSKGFEVDYKAFEEAVIDLKKNPVKRTPPLLNYLDQGLYDAHLCSLDGILPQNNIFVVDKHSLSHEFDETIADLQRYLGLPVEKLPPVITNVRSVVKSTALNRLVRQQGPIKKVLRSLTGTKFRTGVLRAIVNVNKSSRSSSLTDMSEDMREKLDQYYSVDWAATGSRIIKQKRFLNGD